MNVIKYLGKICLAGITACVIISIILCFYSVSPIHIENKKGNTDYIWIPNSYWVTKAEGLAWGKFDSNGFNNISVINNPDIIILGSSHMEAKNVNQDENACYKLNEMFDGKYKVYNMGISGHHLYKVCQYLPASIERFETVPEVVIVETDTVELSLEKVEAVLNGTVEFTPSYSKGIIGFLQKIPILRLMHHQMEDGLLDLFLQKTESTAVVSDITEEETEAQINIDREPYEKLMGYLSSIEEKFNTQIIVFYHPSENLEEDGTISFNNNKSLPVFASEALEQGIDFIDMTSDFENMYYELHQVPHGFVTGKTAFGHLNADGHRVIANALYDVIVQMEEP